MTVIPRLAALVLVGALAGCSAPQVTTSSAPPSARVGLGAIPSPVVSIVDEANFQTPSKNITCALTASLVRCDIINRNWKPPPKPASCQLDWGHGMYVEPGKADFICAGDTVLGSATSVLPYGSSLRAGRLQCDSENAALRCVDQNSQHGFTLAVADYNLF
jgi:hypothetical protein